jgi:hypothetical protein
LWDLGGGQERARRAIDIERRVTEHPRSRRLGRPCRHADRFHDPDAGLVERQRHAGYRLQEVVAAWLIPGRSVGSREARLNDSACSSLAAGSRARSVSLDRKVVGSRS